MAVVTPIRDKGIDEMAMPLVRLEGVSKRFSGTFALRGIDLSIKAGEILGIVGENGAGKSTLIKVLTGAHARSGGRIFVDEKERNIRSPLDAQDLGLNAVHQEVVLCPHLTVAANIFLGMEISRFGMLNERKMIARAQAVLDGVGFQISASDELGVLTIGQQQLVATARATVRESRLIIFDEPTAYLTRQETDQLFRLIDRLSRDGVSVIYISHRMEEVFELCGRAVVLRDGEKVADRYICETDEAELIRDMVSRDVGKVHQKQSVARGDVLLVVEKLSGTGFEDISLTVHRGEVVGLFGLVGAGRSEFVRAVFGRSRVSSGTMRFAGKNYRPRCEGDAMAQGIALVPESRRLQGLCLNQSVLFNTSMPILPRLSRFGVVNTRMERDEAQRHAGALKLVAPGLDVEVASLSGGNQQKILIGKWMSHGADLFIFDEPTAGVDVATRKEIFLILMELLRGGAGVILISSYLPEVYDLSDRLAVMYGGKITRIFDDPRTTGQHAILAAAIGE